MRELLRLTESLGLVCGIAEHYDGARSLRLKRQDMLQSVKLP